VNNRAVRTLGQTPNSAWPPEPAGRPLISVMTSPATMPAAAAGVFGITVPPRPRPIGMGVAIRDPGDFWSDRFWLFGRKSQMVRRDFSRAVPETFAMVDGHIASKRIIFFGTKSEKGRSRFHSAGPRDVSRWSMVGWSTGTRMVAVDVAIAHRGPRDVAHSRQSTTPERRIKRRQACK
jgi:hypothetical protein